MFLFGFIVGFVVAAVAAFVVFRKWPKVFLKAANEVNDQLGI